MCSKKADPSRTRPFEAWKSWLDLSLSNLISSMMELVGRWLIAAEAAVIFCWLCSVVVLSRRKLNSLPFSSVNEKS